MSREFRGERSELCPQGRVLVSESCQEEVRFTPGLCKSIGAFQTRKGRREGCRPRELREGRYQVLNV